MLFQFWEALERLGGLKNKLWGAEICFSGSLGKQSVGFRKLLFWLPGRLEAPQTLETYFFGCRQLLFWLPGRPKAPRQLEKQTFGCQKTFFRLPGRPGASTTRARALMGSLVAHGSLMARAKAKAQAQA